MERLSAQAELMQGFSEKIDALCRARGELGLGTLVLVSYDAPSQPKKSNNDHHCIDQVQELNYRALDMYKWLLNGCIMTNTMLIIAHSGVTFVAGSKKLAFVEPLCKHAQIQNHSLKITLLHTKDFAKSEFLSLAPVGQPVGLCEDIVAPSNSNAGLWKPLFFGFEIVSIVSPIGSLRLTKDSFKLKVIEAACATNNHTAKLVRGSLFEVFRAQENIDYKQVTKLIEERLETLSSATIVEGKGHYTFCRSIPAESTLGVRHIGCSSSTAPPPIPSNAVVFSFGKKLKGLCTTIGRTVFLNPPQVQYHNLTCVLDLRRKILPLLKAGARCSYIYRTMKSFAEAQYPSLGGLFPRSLGSSIGFEFREKEIILSAESTSILHMGHVLNVSFIFDFSSLEGGSYPIVISDTVVVDALAGRCLTDCLNVSRDLVLYEHAKSSPAQQLPLEVLELIFSFLDVCSIARASMTCRQWSNVPWRYIDFSPFGLHPGMSSVSKGVRWSIPLFQVTSIFAPSKGNGGTNRFLEYYTPSQQSVHESRPLRVLTLLNKPRHKRAIVLNLEGISKLAQEDFFHISFFGSLRELNLDRVNVKEANAKTLCVGLEKTLPSLQSLRVLSLRSNLITHTGLQRFAIKLNQMPNLTRVNLDANPVNDAGAELLCQVIAAHPRGSMFIHLGSLTNKSAGELFSSMQLTDKGLSLLRDAVSRNPLYKSSPFVL